MAEVIVYDHELQYLSPSYLGNDQEIIRLLQLKGIQCSGVIILRVDGELTWTYDAENRCTIYKQRLEV